MSNGINFLSERDGAFSCPGVLGGLDDKGTTVILAPIDYLTWNERLANAFKEMGKVDAKEGSPKKQIWPCRGSGCPERL